MKKCKNTNHLRFISLLLISFALIFTTSCSNDELFTEQAVDTTNTEPQNLKAAVGINPGMADAAILGFNNAFLRTSGGNTYYRTSLNNDNPDGTWTLALDIQAMEDAYERTGRADHKQLVSDLCNSFLQLNPPPYDWDGWNDDIAWMGLALIRGHRITGNSNFLTQARYCFDYVWDRGWDTQYNNGGIWEQQPDYLPADGELIKEALSNNPTGKLACYIYQSTGDQWYLDRATQIYDWVWWHIFDSNTGEIYRGIYPDGSISYGPAVYNQGAFVDFANLMYKLTGNENYFRDARRAADYVRNNLTTNGIIANSADWIDTWGDEFARGLGHLCRDNPQLWNTYGDWMVQNSNAIWNNRRTDYDLTWNGWNEPTPYNSDVKVTKYISAVAWLQYTPIQGADVVSGEAYSIISKSSGKAMDVEGNSTEDGANVLQWQNYGQSNQRWIVTSVGDNQYSIINVNSGKSLDLDGGGEENGANVLQWEWHGGSNQRWYIVADGNSYFTIVSAASGRALDVADASTENGDNILQWDIHEGDNQKWEFVK
jgi:predicted alpha-1,6-mannanase (GH76 family)